jgi:hypothetical protein
MSRAWSPISLAGPILAGLVMAAPGPSAAAAAGPSGCVTCHLDESMLVRNLGASSAKKSALQSGAG